MRQGSSCAGNCPGMPYPNQDCLKIGGLLSLPRRCSIRLPGVPRSELKLREEVRVSLESRTASASEPVGYWALLRDNPRYRRLWLGLVVSMAGDWFRTIALYHLVLHLTGGSGLALSGVVLAQTLSLFLMSPV